MGSTGFDLEQSIANHVQLIKGQGSTTSSDEAELTAHLCDACEDLVRSGLSEEEAFLVARRRLGDMEVLTEEYSKVNTTVSTNKIWAYMLLGASIFTGVWKLVFFGIGYIYLLVSKYFDTSYQAIIAIVTFNTLLIALIWYVVKKKDQISKYLEEQVARSPVRAVLWSFAPFVIASAVPYKFRENLTTAFNYPLRNFDSRIAEVSFYLLLFSLAAGLLCLIFSLRKTENITLRSLFEKPSALFLIVFGVMIEMLASFTRVIDNMGTMWISGMFFGLVYSLGAFLITYYNPRPKLVEYLLIFSVLGFSIEILLGVNLHGDSIDAFRPFYYATGIILGVLSGALLGARMKQIAVTD